MHSTVAISFKPICGLVQFDKSPWLCSSMEKAQRWPKIIVEVDNSQSRSGMVVCLTNACVFIWSITQFGHCPFPLTSSPLLNNSYLIGRVRVNTFFLWDICSFASASIHATSQGTPTHLKRNALTGAYNWLVTAERIIPSFPPSEQIMLING